MSAITLKMKHEMLFIPLEFDKVIIEAFVDSGTFLNVISKKNAAKIQTESNLCRFRRHDHPAFRNVKIDALVNSGAYINVNSEREDVKIQKEARASIIEKAPLPPFQDTICQHRTRKSSFNQHNALQNWKLYVRRNLHHHEQNFLHNKWFGASP